MNEDILFALLLIFPTVITYNGLRMCTLATSFEHGHYWFSLTYSLVELLDIISIFVMSFSKLLEIELDNPMEPNPRRSKCS